MDVKELKDTVLRANLLLPKYGLVTFTWGNVSQYDPETGLVAIKPSGVEYDSMTADDIVVLTLDGKKVEGRLNPSSDTPTHLELYRRFKGVHGIVHTHSRMATAFAQARMSIPPLGTTHGDYFHGAIPCTRDMTPEEIGGEYELETGKVIVECCPDYNDIPAALVASHGPFVWGGDAMEAVHNSVVLEELAAMAWITRTLKPGADEMPAVLLDKHYFRKHGDNAYYGQK